MAYPFFPLKPVFRNIINGLFSNLSVRRMFGYLMLAVVCLTGFLSLRWTSSLLLVIALLLGYQKFYQQSANDAVPMFSFIAVVKLIFSILKKNGNIEAWMTQALFGICLLFKKEGMHGIDLGITKLLFLHNPDSVKYVLSSNALLRKGFLYHVMESLLKKGLVTSEGNKWRLRRKQLAPSFHFKILREFVPVFDKHAKIFVRRIHELTQKECIIDIEPVVSLCTLDIALETTMGIRKNTKELQRSEYTEALTTWRKLSGKRFVSPWLWTDFLFYRTKDGQTFRECVNIGENFSREVINERKQERLERLKDMKHRNIMTSDNVIDCKGKRQLALLDLLLDLHLEHNSISLDGIVEEVNTFIAAGYDTTQTAMCWTLYMLGLHQDIQRNVQEEVDMVLGDDIDRVITAEDIKKFKYLHCVLKETMRLYPPIPLLMRTLDEDTVINGCRFSKGTSVVIIIYMVHRNAENFPNPEEFKPERFNEENSKNRHPYAYIPFSGGPRNCIGQKFATCQLIILLATVLRHFNITSVEQRDKIEISFDITLHSERLLLEFTKRHFFEKMS